MKLDTKGYNLIKEFEGYSSRPYKCSAGIPTIGYGNTFYPDGRKVTLKDAQITRKQADDIFISIVDNFALKVLKMINKPITQNQFNALVSFAYNVGVGNFQKSTLLKLVNINPNDAMIAKEFLKWNKAAGKELKGLTNRRIKESALYFTK